VNGGDGGNAEQTERTVKEQTEIPPSHSTPKAPASFLLGSAMSGKLSFNDSAMNGPSGPSITQIMKFTSK